MNDDCTDAGLKEALAAETSCISLVICMLDEIDIASAERRDNQAHMTYALIELWERVGYEDERIAEIRQLAALYAHFMQTIWNMDGFMSSYAKCDIWKLTRQLRSKTIENVISLQEDVMSSSIT